MSRIIAFSVDGRPRAQGSHKALNHKVTGRAVLIGDNEHLRKWRKDLAIKATEATQGVDRILVHCVRRKKRVRLPVVYDEPVCVWAVFRFLTNDPGKHGKPMMGTPDLDKLNRAVGDALKDSGVVSDDCRIVGWPVVPGKIWDMHREGVEVVVHPLWALPKMLRILGSNEPEQLGFEVKDSNEAVLDAVRSMGDRMP